MVEIVMRILRQLQRLRGTDAIMKQQLSLLLDSDDVVEVTWAMLSAWRSHFSNTAGDDPRRISREQVEGTEGNDLHNVRKALEVGNVADSASAETLNSLLELSRRIAEALEGRKDLTLPPKLLINADAQQACARGLGTQEENGTGRLQEGNVTDRPLLLAASGTPTSESEKNTSTNASTSKHRQNLETAIRTDKAINQVQPDAPASPQFNATPRDAASARTKSDAQELLSQKVDANAIDQMLRRVLRRQPVRRHRIYELFVQHYLEREARKQIGAASSSELVLEGRTFAERLALKMTEENLSKFIVRKASALFDARGEWDTFVSTRDPLIVAARNAAPVRFQGAVLSFTHKTVQEFLCAEGLRQGALC